ELTRAGHHRPRGRPRRAAGARGFSGAVRRESTRPAGPERRSRSGLVIADSSRWPGLALCAIGEGFTARVALPAGLAVPAGLPAWPPAAGPPAGRPSASGTTGTRTTGAGTVHGRIARTRTGRIWAAGTGPRVGL